MDDHERLFVAILAPAHLVAELIALQRNLDQRLSHRAIRWTTPEQFHLTLLFLGRVTGDRIPDLVARLDRAVKGSRALDLGLKDLGAFPSESHPRIVWVGVDGDLPGLKSLQERVALAGGPYVECPEGRAYQPHLTLGRVGPDPRDIRVSAHLFKEIAPMRVGSWSAGEVVLVRRQLSPAGSTYPNQVGQQIVRLPLAA